MNLIKETLAVFMDNEVLTTFISEIKNENNEIDDISCFQILFTRKDLIKNLILFSKIDKISVIFSSLSEILNSLFNEISKGLS